MEIGRDNFDSIHKSVTDYFLKEQYMWFSGENGLKKEEAK